MTSCNNIFAESANKSADNLLLTMQANVKEISDSMITMRRYIPFNDGYLLYLEAEKQALSSRDNPDEVFREACYNKYGQETADNYFRLTEIVYILRDFTGKNIKLELVKNSEFRAKFNTVNNIISPIMLQDIIVAKFGYGECGERSTKLIMKLATLTDQPLHRVELNKDDIDNHVFVLSGKLPKPVSSLQALKSLSNCIYGDALFNLTGRGEDITSISDLIPFIDKCKIVIHTINPVEVQNKLNIIDELVNIIYLKISQRSDLFKIIKDKSCVIKEKGEIVELAQPVLHNAIETTSNINNKI